MSRNLKRMIALTVIALVATGGLYAWREGLISKPTRIGALVLYGNVEIRQVDLAFGVDGPLAEVLVDEGDYVAAGQTLAVLDQDAFRYAEANSEALLRSAEAKLDELVAGSRTQEIERSKATVFSAESSLENAAINLRRAEQLSQRNVASDQSVDLARMAQRTADAALRQARADLALRIEGTRPEQITQQRAEVEARRAELALQQYRLKRSTLRAPNNGIVLTRVREPGSVVTQNSPVLTVSVIDPVWVRAYVDEPNLGRVVPGTAVDITTDTIAGKTYRGRIGFVSPTAEFTPKSVETPELRTQLVYRVRVVVENPDHGLRQGMPVTAQLGAPSTEANR